MNMNIIFKNMNMKNMNAIRGNNSWEYHFNEGNFAISELSGSD